VYRWKPETRNQKPEKNPKEEKSKSEMAPFHFDVWISDFFLVSGF
jgi:hypothetical protein